MSIFKQSYCKGLNKLLFYSFLTLLSFGSKMLAQTTTLPTFTTNTTWTCPPGVTSINVQAWGGGGGGSGVASVAAKSGGGGSGGCYVKNTAIAVTPGQNYTITIGTGGAGGVGKGDGTGANTPSVDGGFSSVTSVTGSTLLIRAGGGKRGTYISAGVTGQGGVAVTTDNLGYEGSFNYKGGNGADGVNGTGTTMGTPATGGGAAGSSGNGTGATPGTGGGAGAAAIVTSGSGTAGTAPGGGGGGGASASASAKNGGKGGDGWIIISYATPAGPAITVTPTSLTGFSTSTTSASSSQSFTISGSTLTNDITISAPTYSEISTNNSTFSSTITLTAPGSGTIGDTTIYVRLKAGLTNGSVSENITASSTGATSKTVAVSGTVYKNFYYNSGSLHDVSSWTLNSDGSGANPSNFTSAGQAFYILKDATSSSTGWTVSGTGSKIILGSTSTNAVALTIANGAPILGPLDITAAASSGSNKLIISHNIAWSTGTSTFNNPTWGTIDPSTTIEISGSTATNVLLGGTGNLFNKTIKSLRVVNNALAKINSVTNNNITVTGQFYIEAGSSFFPGSNSTNYLNIASTGSALIEGTLVVEKQTGFVSTDATASVTSSNINFAGGSVNMTLGANSIIDYSRTTATGTPQTISARTDYKTINISGGNYNRNIPGNVTVSGNINVTGLNATTNIAATGTITASAIVFNGLTALLASSPQTISSTTTGFLANTTAEVVIKGTATLGSADIISNASKLTLSGGTFGTGATTGFSETAAALGLTDNSTIALGTGVHALTFSASNTQSWTIGKTLTVTGWTGTAGQSGTAGKIFVGTSASGLTAQQLSQISFSGYSSSITMLSTGELVPSCANPTSGGTIAGTQSLCSPANPADFTNSVSPSGQSGTLEFQWQSSTNNVTFSDIAGAAASTYNAPTGLTTTTYYKRLARVSCQSDWSGAAESNVIKVTVDPTVTPTFTQVNPICLGGTLSALPTTSTNGITGTWSPAINSSTTTTYAFAPSAGQCATTVSMTITVNNSVAGTVSANQTIISGMQPANISLTNSSGAVQWQKSTNGTTFIDIVGATNSVLSGNQMGALTANRFFRAVVKSGNCASVFSSVVSVTVVTSTSIIDAQCGTTLAALNTDILAYFVQGVTDYRFKVVANGTTEVIQSGNKRYFNLTALINGVGYNTAYSISVGTKFNGVWGNYSAECVVYTPSTVPVTKVRTAQCGATLADLNTDILADWLQFATAYRFKVVANGATEVIETGSLRYFKLTALSGGAAYSTAYTISVAAKHNGVWGGYGTECVVSTPVTPTTKVQSAQCGATLAALNTDIQADWLQFATDYRFKVVANGTTQVIERGSLRYFNLTSLTAGASYNTAYTISVAVKHNGVWGDYSTECVVTTPLAPTTKVQASQCGATLPALSTDITADWLQFATAYRFKVIVNGASYIVSPLGNRRYFRLTSLPVPVTAGTAYTISVAAQFNGVWGDYATECNVTTPGTAPTSKQETETAGISSIDFSLIAYPNPSNSTFYLHVKGATEDAVSILVFDMAGRQIENKVVNATAIENISLGQNYSAGIYNIIVSQGMNTKTARLVKN